MRHADGVQRRWALVTPALILIIVWWLLPAIATAGLTIVDGGSLAITDSIRFIVSDGAAREAIRNTVLWVVGVTIGTTVLGLLLAAVAHKLRAGRSFLTFILLPTVMAPAAVAIIWRSTLAFRPGGTDQVGLANALLALPGLSPVAWLTQAPINTLLLAAALVWMQTGVAVLILSAAIARVPGEVQDAARVDGASELQVFGRITVPSIKGALLVAGLSAVVVAVRVFDLIKVATDGQYATSVLGTEMFDQAFLHNNSSRGAILALAMAGLVAPVAFAAARRALRDHRTEAET